MPLKRSAETAPRMLWITDRYDEGLVGITVYYRGIRKRKHYSCRRTGVVNEMGLTDLTLLIKTINLYSFR